MTDNWAMHGEAPAGEVEALRQSVAQLRDEVAALRSSRERLVLATDRTHREIERTLHRGLQQQLVALAVNVQLARHEVDSDPGAAKTLLEAIENDLRATLADAARLAERIYPPLLEAGLAVVLRSALTSAGLVASVDVAGGARYPDVVARTIHLACLETLSGADADARATVSVRDDNDETVLEISVDRGRPRRDLDALRDRIEALGGTLTVSSAPGRGFRVTARLPVAR